MRSPRVYTYIACGLGLTGLLFSGYLSAVKYLTNTCALSEPCPYFLGYPACWYGFGMYVILFSAALLALFGAVSVRLMARAHIVVGVAGILFAGYFTVPEIVRLVSGSGMRYALGLPTCAYGLIFYILITYFAVRHLATTNQEIV